MRHILTAIFSGALIFAFANVSNSKPSPLGTANYVYENADRFDGKSVTIYVRYAKAIMAKKRAQIYVGFGPTDTFPAPNGPFDKLSDEVMAMIQKDYIPFEAVTVDSNGNKHGTIIVLVKNAKAKNFAQKYKNRVTRKSNGSTVEQQRIGLNGRYDKEFNMIIMR